MTSHASMNRIYRLVFNAALGIWVAVAENAKGRGKGGRAASALLAVLAILSPAAYAANAADATLRGGTGTVATVGNTTTINQSSQRMALDWTQLSTAANEALKFNQPNAQAIALNRITGSSPSSFLGSLTANGQVFILNPNGILFGADSQVNVGGIVASTLGMNPTDFMNGSDTFTKTTGTGSVVNQGSMTAAQGGYLALLAPEVRNEGIMTASLGTALLAAGNKVTLNLDNGSLLGYSIDEKVIGALVENKQLIKADGGQVILSARAVDSLSAGVVNNTGIIEAKSLTSVGGKILLEGDLVIQGSTLNASGTSGGEINVNARAIIDAGTAKADGTAGSGGNISYNATQAIVQSASANLSANGTTNGGHISLNSDNNLFTSGTLSATGQNGGTIDLLGDRVVLSAASVDASGSNTNGGNGGLIRVGGDFKGANPNIRNAQTTFVNGATTLQANGANGRVAVWSDDKTDFYGNIVATGNGNAEVSSKGTLTYGGNAALGAGGTLLLDPANIILDNTAGPAAFALQDPNSFAGKQFGSNLTLLGTTTGTTFTQNGKVVIAARTDNLGGASAGAVYLFDTSTGALISTLTGSAANDQVGNGDITALSNGNYVVRSSSWSGNRGAATWGSGTAGVSGAVSAANSLVGSTANDGVSNDGITALSNGNYVVGSQSWNGNRGAVTWGSGTAGVSGAVSAANSLVGSTANDLVGSDGITALTNGNYVVRSSSWNGNSGAATWGSGTAGVSGAVSAANSLVGSTANDAVGSDGITALSNGNYLVGSVNWNGRMGAVTWGSGTAGVSGAVSAANSLVGSTASDRVGSDGITALNNGNYVVRGRNWNGNMGAVTWGSGTAGISGAVSATNSLVGSTANDLVGNGVITALNNGNYVVSSGRWNGDRGAVTWGSGTAGVSGAISAGNSLVGSTSGDLTNSPITALTNGNYVVSSSAWNGNTGAVTWGSGTAGVSGAVSAANSLVGSTGGDAVGSNGITALTNGNYVVGSFDWNGGMSAVTWVSGTTGAVGAVSAANSLVGSTTGGRAGLNSVTALTNGNYVVNSSAWNNNRGAVTWGSGTAGAVGAVSAANSLVGSTANDQVGINNITVLTNGNYVVRSSGWNGFRGAATWGSGTAGVSGAVSAANSLVGSTGGDNVGNFGITALSNGSYVVNSSIWNGNFGAATWGSGTAGVSGAVSAANSLVGSTAGDRVGNNGLTALSNGNYVVNSSQWGAAKGAVTWGSGTAGVVGAVSAANSLVGSTANDFIGSSGVAALTNGNYVVGSQNWNGDMGAATWGSGTAGVSGAVSAANSLVGSTASDFVGSGVTALSNGNYVVASSSFAGNTGQVLIGTPGNIGFDTASGQTLRINPSGISATLAGGTAVTLQASNDITVNSNIMVAGMAGGAFTLQAGRSINLNSVITTANGNFTASAGDAAATGPGRMAGDAAINQAAGSSINAGTGVVTLLVNGKSINSSGSSSSSSSSSSSNAVTTASATDTPQFVSALQSVYQPSRQEPGSTGDSPFGNIGRVDPLVVLNAAANDE